MTICKRIRKNGPGYAGFWRVSSTLGLPTPGPVCPWTVLEKYLIGRAARGFGVEIVTPGKEIHLTDRRPYEPDRP